jgi:chemotaxis protein methyltransferase CheR
MSGLKSYQYDIDMTEEERIAFSTYIENEFGIKMPEVKKPLLTGRLSKRLHYLNLNSYSEYYDYIHEPSNFEEKKRFIDLISTHETSFFREVSHYDFLLTEIFPALIQKGAGIEREITILSSACSSGEELYSAACVIEEIAIRNKIRNPKYRLVGTDISVHVLKTAARGVYRAQVIKKIPDYARKFFMTSRDSKKDLIRVIPEIRAHAEFMEMNLLAGTFPFGCNFDIIFCRNVLIYFDKKNQEKVTVSLCRYLAPGGYLLVGHSETLIGLSIPLKNIAPATYVFKSQ